MSRKVYIGIDNGVSGSIAKISDDGIVFEPTPVKKEQSYTKAKNMITRVDAGELSQLLWEPETTQIVLAIERPMVNPKMFKATMSAIRALEATLVVLEGMFFPIAYIDSKEWQKVMLPKGVKGSEALKKASLDIACRMYPRLREDIEKQGDGDSILIAEYLKRNS